MYFLAPATDVSWASGDVIKNDCLLLEDVCNLQAAFVQRAEKDIIPPYVIFDMPTEDAYLFLVDGEFVTVFRNKGDEQ